GKMQYLLQRIRTLAEQTRQNTQRSLEAMAYLVGSMAGLPERKTVLYLSDGLEMRPAEALFHAHYDRFERAAEIYTFDNNLDPAPLLAQEYDMSGQFEQLAAYAQANQVILSAIDASGQEARFAGSADARLRDSDSASVAGFRPVWSNRLDILHTQNRQSTLRLLAEETGGQVLVNNRNYADFFRTFDETLGNYYSLGFVASPDSEGQRHDVVVKVDRPGVTVRYQRTLVDKSWEQALSEQTLSRVVLGAGRNELVFNALPGDITTQDGKKVLPIHIFVPVEGLSLIPDGDEYVASLALSVVVKKPSGDTNPPQVFVMGLRLPRADVDAKRVKTGEAAVRLVVDPSRQEIGIGLRDQGNGATATAAFEVDAS
ncbi:MAG: hypothetical protein R3190_16525, partial [Thermoanaerobaculia bacterium]|nr:hypothetical protein [Thermoanaerobaculia bacterium]